MACNIEKFFISEKAALASVALDPKEKIIFDCIISKSPEFTLSDPVLFIDIHSSSSKTLYSAIDRLTFRKSVNLFDMTGEMEVTSTFSQEIVPDAREGSKQTWTEEFDESINKEDSQDYVAFVDPRLKKLGTRTLSAPGMLDVSEELIQVDLDYYKSHRILAGVPEGPSLVGQNPLVFGMNYFHMVPKDKVFNELQGNDGILPFAVSDDHQGEELVMDYPFYLLDVDYKIPVQGKVLDKDGKTVGIVVESCKNLGFVRGNIQKMNECRLSDGRKLVTWIPFILRN